MSKKLSCPLCESNDLYAYVHSDNIPSKGEVRDWAIKCNTCKFEIQHLSKDGSEASAVRDWNKEVTNVHILNYLNSSEIKYIAFDGGISFDAFVEKYNYTERKLKLDLNILAKELKVEKHEFKNIDFETLPIGKKYHVYNISESGKESLLRLKRKMILLKEKNK